MCPSQQRLCFMRQEEKEQKRNISLTGGLTLTGFKTLSEFLFKKQTFHQ